MNERGLDETVEGEQAGSGEAIAPSKRRVRTLVMSRLTRLRAVIWLIVSLIVCSILLNFIHEPTVEFALSAQVEGFSFIAPEVVTTEATVVRGAQLQAVDTVTVDGRRLDILPASGVALESLGGMLTLSSLSVPKDWRISLARGDANHLLVSASPPDTVSNAQHAKLTFVAGPETRIQRFSETMGRTVVDGLDDGKTIQVLASDVALELDVKEVKLIGYTSISDLSLARDGKTIDEAGHQTAFVEGAAISGTLWREHAPREIIALGPIDLLIAHDVHDGILRNVVWRDDKLSLVARGVAGSLHNKVGVKSSDLRPVLLDVVQDIGLLKIILGIVTFIGGFELSRFVRERK